jgi:hypothetical protein
LRSWLFKGIALEQTIERAEAQGLSVRPGATPASVQRLIALDDFSLPIRVRAMTAMPAYMAFFCLENAMRELVQERLQEKVGSEWWATAAPNPVKREVDKRRLKEGINRWHIDRGAHEIYYTNFGDLKSIMVSNWTHFEDLFPDQNWIISRLDELEASRNIIAHSNVLDDREMVRLKLYLQDWTRQVG